MKSISCIRRNRILFRIYHSVEIGSGAFVARILDINGEKIERKSSGSDVVATEYLDDTSVLLLGPVKNYKLPRRFQDFMFDLPSIPVKKISVDLRRADGSVEPVDWVDPALGIDEVLPRTREEFRKYFSYIPGRHIDTKTVRFIAKIYLIIMMELRARIRKFWGTWRTPS
ncbi:hypothetical protein KHC28_25840 [Ancylobacter sonchi]|uniref:hypothetical protein n=1 Tax=Ancylobacter sonchi TaxID=1937790 RepID=UPI001BD1E3DF|nr:hypothetical protein [Ancylobacter sonchi]MBS7537075.1 hypothetical protein [Ancylobacter sonchi]